MNETKHKNSVKRQAILDALQHTTAHPSAETIYAELKPQFPNLSLATVYRNVGEFCADGKALSLGSVQGKDRFDARLDPHAHFVCRKCGKIIDVNYPDGLTTVCEEMNDTYRFQIESCSLRFNGLCSECCAAECEA